MEFSFKCPFCSRDVEVSASNVADENYVVHEHPVCRRFKQLEPEAFLRKANEAIAKRKEREGAETTSLVWPKSAPTPESGDRFIACAHVRTGDTSRFSIYKFTQPQTFMRPDGTMDDANWMLMCPECHKRYGEDPLKCPVGGDGIYKGEGDDEPKRRALRLPIGRA